MKSLEGLALFLHKAFVLVAIHPVVELLKCDTIVFDDLLLLVFCLLLDQNFHLLHDFFFVKVLVVFLHLQQEVIVACIDAGQLQLDLLHERLQLLLRILLVVQAFLILTQVISNSGYGQGTQADQRIFYSGAIIRHFHFPSACQIYFYQGKTKSYNIFYTFIKIHSLNL